MGGKLQTFAFHTAQEAWRQAVLVQNRMPLSNAYSHVSLASAVSRRNIMVTQGDSQETKDQLSIKSLVQK